MGMRREAGLAGAAEAFAEMSQVAFAAAAGDRASQRCGVVVVRLPESPPQQAVDCIVHIRCRGHELLQQRLPHRGAVPNVPGARPARFEPGLIYP
jgi:hypothetical protein